MGRPKGSKNKGPHPGSAVPDLVLTLRRLNEGSFSGLWELCKVNADGSMTVLTDANTKQIAANLARNEIVRCGT